MMVPEKMRDFAKDHPDDLGRQYHWDRPHVPAGPTVVVSSYSEVQRLLSKPKLYTSSAQKRLEILTGGVHLDFASVEQVLTNEEQLENAAQALSSLTDALIKGKQLKGVGPHTVYIDIVRDVINLISVHWLSNDIVCTNHSTELHHSLSPVLDWASSEN
jgi:hypothetical protein